MNLLLYCCFNEIQEESTPMWPSGEPKVKLPLAENLIDARCLLIKKFFFCFVKDENSSFNQITEKGAKSHALI